MSTQHIGAAGELLVQYKLLKHEIDSARLTTDAGLDMVVYVPARSMALTVQVKTKQKPTPGGGRGKLAIEWTFNPECGADLMAFVDLSSDSVWLFRMVEAEELAQQKLPSRHKLYWYTDMSVRRRAGVPLVQTEMEQFRLENRISELFSG